MLNCIKHNNRVSMESECLENTKKNNLFVVRRTLRKKLFSNITMCYKLNEELGKFTETLGR